MSLIALDTFRSLFGGNENDNGEVQAVMNDLRRLIRETGAAVMFSHHLNKPWKDGAVIGPHRVRGATSLIGAIDGHIQLHEARRGPGWVTIDAHQLKDRAGSDEPGFRYHMDYDADAVRFTWLGALSEAKEHRAQKQDQLSLDIQAITAELAGGPRKKDELLDAVSKASKRPRRADSVRKALDLALKKMLSEGTAGETTEGYGLQASDAAPEGTEGQPA